MGIIRLDVGSNRLVLTFPSNGKTNPTEIVTLVKRDPVKFRFLSENRLAIRLGFDEALSNLSKIETLLESLTPLQST
jgi:hypothetical protein